MTAVLSRSTALFLLRGALVYVALLASWSWIDGAFGLFFRETVGLSLEVLGFASVKLEPSLSVHGRGDTTLLIDRDACTVLWFAHLDSWFVSFLPNAVFLALVLASPTRVARRLGGFLVGLALVQAFVTARVVFILARGMIEHLPQCTGQHPAIVSSDVGRRFLVAMDGALYEPLLNAAVPAVLWLLSMVRSPRRRGAA